MSEVLGRGRRAVWSESEVRNRFKHRVGAAKLPAGVVVRSAGGVLFFRGGSDRLW